MSSGLARTNASSRAGVWRILIGKDAAQLDAFVRANPDASYDYAEMAKSFQSGEA